MNLLENFLSQVNNTSTWLTILLDASMKGAVILLAASVLCFFLRRTSAAARHLVWSLALISVLALPVFSMLLPGWNLPVLPKITIIERPTDAAKIIDDFFSSYSGNAATREYQILPNITTMEQQAVETKTFDNLLSTYSGSAAIQENQLKSLETVPSSSVNENPNGLTEIQAQSSTLTPNAISESPSAGLNWSAWLVIIWLIGALSVFARMLIGVIGVHIVKRCAQPVTNTSIVNLSHRIAENLGLKRRFKLLKSSRTRVPMTLGFLKPAVLLPEDAEKWSPARQKVVLLHELAHIKRSDIVYNVISQAVAALYWFNPLVWYAHHVLYAERERACDDYVIVSGVKSIDYANHLLDIARSLRSEKWISFAPVTMARRSQLEWRMRAILDPKKCRRALKPITTIATCLIVAALVMPFAAMQPVEKEVKIPEEHVSKTEKINIPLTSVKDIEENLPEGIDAQQQQRNQLIANVIRSLIDSLKSENTEVKMEAVYTLNYLIGASSDYLKDSSLLDALIPLIKDKDAEVRLGALLLVEKFEESETALEALLDAIHDENAKIREGACDFLGDRIRKMSQTETAEIPTIDPRILNALKDALNDEELKVRMTALKYFRYMPESNALELLIAALKDKDERVRIDAVEYLSRLQSPEAMDALITAMSDSSAIVQLAIVRALNVIKRGTTRISSRTGINIISDSELDEVDLKMLDIIMNVLRDENYRNRVLAIRIISEVFVAEKSFDALIAAVEDENPEVRMQVVHALGRINDPRVIQILIAALKDEDISVRMTAATELGRIRDIRENLPEETIQKQEETLKAVQKEIIEDIQKSAVTQTGIITGHVLDENTKHPLIGVKIEVKGTEVSTATDDKGYFVITNLQPSAYSVSASRIGYIKQNKVDILVVWDKITPISFVLTPQKEVGKIEGYVKDKNTEQPLSGANITINGTKVCAVTDEKGYYIIRNVPPRAYSLTASMEGYWEYVYENVRVISMERSTRLDFNLTDKGEEIILQDYYYDKIPGKIDGYVTDKNTGQPLVRTIIVVNETATSVFTDENGYFTIPNVQPGNYSLSVSMTGYIKQTKDIIVKEGYITKQTQEKPPLIVDMTTSINFIMVPQKEVGKIDGYVKDKNTEQPHDGVNIIIIGTPLSAVTDEKGYFVIPNVPTVTYLVIASKSGYKEQIQENVIVAAGKTTPLRFAITQQKDAGNIEGYVTDKNTGKPLAGVNIFLNDTTSARKDSIPLSGITTLSYEEITRMPVSDLSKLLAAQSSITVLTNTPYISKNQPIAVTDENGYYIIRNVPPGIYSLIAKKEGYFSNVRDNVQVEMGKTTRLDFNLTEGVEDIEIQAYKPSGKIDGYVKDRNTGKPLVGADVSIIGTSLQAVTDKTGYFVIPEISQSTYSISASITGYKKQIHEGIEVREGITSTCNFLLSAVIEDIVIQLSKPSGKIDGYVKDKNSNQPLIGATISINGTSLRAQTDEKGYFVVPNVPHGIYSVSASRIGYLKLNSARLRVTEGMTVTINYRLTALKEVGKIHGYVTDKNTGQPLAGVNIFLNDTTSARKDSIPLSRIKTLSYEEITRMPVSDLSKLLATQSNITILKDTLTKKILDKTSRVTTLSYEEIIKMPVSDLSKLLTAQSSITVLTNTPVKKGGYEARDVQDIRMRSGRNEEVALVIDGQAVRNPIFGGFSTSAEQSNILARPIAVTDEYGYFVIPNVPPGIYSLTASKTGYKSQTQENVRVTVGVITQLPFEMTVIKEAAESVQDTEQKQEYMATVLLRDSTIKKLDNVNFIIPDGIRMTTEGITIPGKNIEIIPSESGRKLQKMVILKLETAGGVKLYYSIDTMDKETMVVDLTIVHVKIYYDDGKVVIDARFFYDSNSKIMVKGIDESTKKEWSVELDKIKEIVFALK